MAKAQMDAYWVNSPNFYGAACGAIWAASELDDFDISAVNNAFIQVGIEAFSSVVQCPVPSQDSDEDGVQNLVDNCIDEPNGPNEPGPSQLDADGDGFGNLCDGDFNQDGLVTGGDFNTWFTCFSGFPGLIEDPNCEESDMNGDGVVTGGDFGTWFSQFTAGRPGISGLPLPLPPVPECGDP